MKKILLILLASSYFLSSYAQDNSPYYQSNGFDLYIEYLINSGELDIRHPLHQPFTVCELMSGLKNIEKGLTTVLLADLKRYLPRHDSSGGLNVGSNLEGKIELNSQNWSSDFLVSPYFTYSYKNINAYVEYTANTEYLNDTTYFGTTGKLQNSTFSRTSTSYLKYSNAYMEFFVGRMGRNFGLFGNRSLIWSDNSYSFDHCAFSLFNQFVKFSFSLARLEDKYAYDIRHPAAGYDWYKRFFSFHRIEISLTSWLEIALSESILFGGINQVPLWYYTNPMNVFFLSKMNDRKGYEERNANSLASIEVFLRPWKKMALYSQFLLDDMDFTKELREKVPDRIGFYTKLSLPDFIRESQVYISHTRISNWTYNSFYTFGNYTFYNQSLGYGKNGFQNITLGIDVFSIPNLIVKAEFLYEQEREQDLDAAFTGVKSGFPIGVEQSTTAFRTRALYFPKSWIQLILDLELANIKNYQYRLNQNKSIVFIQVGVKINGITAIKT